MNANEPAIQSTKLIDFERADVISPMIYPPRPRLVVSGKKPYPMRVELVPLMYVLRPEYWGIEVVGTVAGGPGPSVMPAITNIPYVVELDLEGVTGTVGVEVLGANKTEQIPVPTVEATTQFVGPVEEALFRPAVPTDVRGQALKLTTSSVKEKIAPEANQIDLAPYDGSILRVTGHHEGDWIYSATVVEQARDSILSVVAKYVFQHVSDEG